MKIEDFRAAPCACPECRQAGVTDLERVRDPQTGRLLHGSELRRWYEARAQFKRLAREAVGKPGRHGAGFEWLVK